MCSKWAVAVVWERVMGEALEDASRQATRIPRKVIIWGLSSVELDSWRSSLIWSVVYMALISHWGRGSNDDVILIVMPLYGSSMPSPSGAGACRVGCGRRRRVEGTGFPKQGCVLLGCCKHLFPGMIGWQSILSSIFSPKTEEDFELARDSASFLAWGDIRTNSLTCNRWGEPQPGSVALLRLELTMNHPSRN